jgi:eukaryotic-like serine/threonine-protein kinase
MADPLERLASALADQYIIEREAGVGGMATVYVARDLKHDRRVALKVLKPELAALLGVERFLSEIRVTAHLQHPHILPLFDSGQVGGLIYYVMPHVEGESLRQRLARERQLPVDTTVEIARAVASALDYAHRHGVIHRDIKPENILFQDGQALVADFGIALALRAAGGSRLTETGLSLGTPQYMSPEQATGERALDARSDLYSLGAVVYEMLAGEPPHTGPTVQSVIAKVLTERPRPLRALRDSVPPAVEAAIQKALAKLPADRFASAAQFADALTHAGPASPAAGADARGRGRRARVLAPWALATLALAGAAWWWARAGPKAPPPPVVRFMLSFGKGFQAIDFRGSSVALSPDGARLVYVGNDALGSRWLYTRPLDSVEPTLIPATLGAGEPFFSPDGQWIGFWQEDRLQKVSLAGGAVVPICETPGAPDGASWGSRDVIVFGALGALYQVPAAGGTPERVATPDSGGMRMYRWPEFLPDGRTVLVTLIDSSGPALAAVSLDEHRVRLLGETGFSPHYVDGGVVVFGQSDGTLFAAPFDLRGMRFSGPPEPVAVNVRTTLRAVAKVGMSRTGSFAYLSTVSSFAPREMVIVSRTGRAQALPVPPDRYRTPRFSPDGRRIAVGIDHANAGIALSDIWVYELGAHSLSRLTFDSSNAYPEWSRDGRRVAFARQLDKRARVALFQVAADGSGTPETLLVRPQPVWEVQFTPDQRTMVFRENHPQTHRDIWMAPLANPQAAVPLLRTPFEERAIALSSDGRWLAYVSNETGGDEIYVRRLQEGSARWRVSTRGGTEPRWGRGGRELFFRNGDSVYAVAIELGHEIRPGPPRALFGGRYQVALEGGNVSYDVSPDGSRFLFVREQAAGGGEELNVVLHWFDQVWRGRRSPAPANR